MYFSELTEFHRQHRVTDYFAMFVSGLCKDSSSRSYIRIPSGLIVTVFFFYVFSFVLFFS